MQQPLPPLSKQAKDLKLGVYKHYSGSTIQLMSVGRHSETLEEMAMYKHLDDGNFWVRPLTMFCEEIEVDGKRQPRFLFVHE